MTDPTKWAARSIDLKQKAYVQAATYIEAKQAACRKFGFVRVKFDKEEFDMVAVEIEIARDGERPFAGMPWKVAA